MMKIIPAPAWFRTTVREWFSDTSPMHNMTDRAIDELFTRLVQRQPPVLIVKGFDNG